MVWRIEYDIAVRKTIEKLDRQTRQRIRDFLHDRLGKLDDPRQNGKALKGSALGSFCVIALEIIASSAK